VHIAIEVVALATVVSLVSAGARRYGLSAPLLLVLTGIVASYLWFVPRVQLTSEVVLVGFLPPLLYAT
jgi:NhaP-type Na+/H+ or K+/H+ antiporter